jgi:hypothetical protein
VLGSIRLAARKYGWELRCQCWGEGLTLGLTGTGGPIRLLNSGLPALGAQQLAGTDDSLNDATPKTSLTDEGAHFWCRVITDLHARGVEDVLIALIDGLPGLPAAIARVFPKTQVHTCVVHVVRRSLAFVSYKDRKAVAKSLRTIHQADMREAAAEALTTFTASPLGQRYPTIAPLWTRQWDTLMAAFTFPRPIRRILTITNAIERMHMQLRKILKTRGHFPTDDAAAKLIYLALGNIHKRWSPSPQWQAALQRFTLVFPDRFTPCGPLGPPTHPYTKFRTGPLTRTPHRSAPPCPHPPPCQGELPISHPHLTPTAAPPTPREAPLRLSDPPLILLRVPRSTAGTTPTTNLEQPPNGME